MGYNIYDEIAELIELKAEVSYEEMENFAYELNVFIQECVNNVESDKIQIKQMEHK